MVMDATEKKKVVQFYVDYMVFPDVLQGKM